MSSDLGVGSGHHRTTNIETYTVQYIQAIYVPTGISHCHFDDDFQTHHTCHMVFVNSEENALWWIPGAWFWPACIHLSPQVLALGCWCCWWVFWGLFLNVIFSWWWWWCQMFDCWSPFFAFFCQGDCRNSFFGLESRGATDSLWTINVIKEIRAGLLDESGPNSKNTPVRHRPDKFKTYFRHM